MPKVADIMNQALELTEGERADLAAQLIDSLSPEQDADWATAWDVEIQRRLDEMKSGAVHPIAWDAARRMIAGEDVVSPS